MTPGSARDASLRPRGASCTIALRAGDWDALGEHAGQVRRAVFVQEQGIPLELEWDEWDARSLHCVAYADGAPIGTGRLLPDGHIGRMAVLATWRGAGVGSRVLERLMQAGVAAGHPALALNAQSAVAGFYRRYGFEVTGDPFVEAGIDHIAMVRTMGPDEHSVARPDGTALWGREWRALRPSSRGVYLLHGLGEHAGRYDALARRLAAQGWRVRAHDHRGHGRSDGARGALPSAAALVDDAQALVREFERSLGAPPVVLGHSMGGAIATDLALARAVPMRGLVLSSPALDAGVSGLQRAVTAVFRVLAPSVAVDNGLPTAGLSHDAAVVRAYEQDPLVHRHVTARLVGWLLEAGARAIERAPALTVPTLLMVGGADRLVDPRGARRFAARAPAERLTLRWYDDAYHELFNEDEPRRARVLGDLDAWLAALE